VTKGNVVSSQSGVLATIVSQDPMGELVDGQFVRARVEAETPIEQVVVPSAALVIDQQGPYVFIVEDGKAVVRRLKLGQDLGRSFVVQEGLKGGEQVIVDGIATLRPGAAVVAAPSKGV
jgi:membrane fusion protein (multidrug efflux system)